MEWSVIDMDPYVNPYVGFRGVVLKRRRGCLKTPTPAGVLVITAVSVGIVVLVISSVRQLSSGAKGSRPLELMAKRAFICKRTSAHPTQWLSRLPYEIFSELGLLHNLAI